MAMQLRERYKFALELVLPISGLALLLLGLRWLDRNPLWGPSALLASGGLQFFHRKGPFDVNSRRATCFKYAQSQSQPYDQDYNRTKMELFINLEDTPPVYFRWEGSINREEFDRVENHTGLCVFFKFLDGKLHVKQSGASWGRLLKRPNVKHRYDTMVEMLLLTAFFYKIKDVDFIVEFEDELQCNIPALTYSVKPYCTKGGFAIPSYSAFRDSLGQEQISALYRCLDSRYPTAYRQPRVVWRGSTTGSVLSKDNYLMNTRVRLALLGRSHERTMDVGLSAYVQLQQDESDAVQRLLKKSVPLLPPIDFEDFNKYALIVDLDGNGWSDRFGRLVFFNTPLLKQNSTRNKEYFAHLMDNNTHVISFNADLSGFAALAESVLEDHSENPGKYKTVVRNMQEFARKHLSHHGVLHATAYALRIVSDKLTWSPSLEDDYVYIPAQQCCGKLPSFPQEVKDAIKKSLG